MKFKNFLLLALTVLLVISLISCEGTTPGANVGNGESADNIADTKTPSSESNVDSGSETPDVAVSVFLGETDIEKYSIVFDSNDTVAKSICDFLTEKTKAITGKDIATAESAEGLEYAIVIGTNSLPEAELGDNEFIIKFVGNNLCVSYSEGADAFQAVSTVLEDSLFASYNRVNDAHTLVSDFEFFGKCGDYIIGDNEFNPFE